MKKILFGLTILSFSAHAQFGAGLDLSANWSSTTEDDADAVTTTAASVDTVELSYSKEIKNGWNLDFAIEYQDAAGVVWTTGYLAKSLDNFDFSVGRIGALTASDDDFRFYGYSMEASVAWLNTSDDGVEVAYTFMPNHKLVIQSHLDNGLAGNFATTMFAYRGELENKAAWNAYYAQQMNGGDETQMGADLKVMLNALTLSCDYTSYKLNSDADAKTSLIAGASYEMGAFAPYAHVALETTDDDYMGLDAGVKMNWGGPNYYFGGKYITADAADTTTLVVAAALEHYFDL